MKIGIVILLISILILNVSAQDKWISPDKALHFTYSALGTALFTNTLKDYNVKAPEIKGATIMFGIGLSKELFYDTKVSYKDLTADLLGCVVGTYVNRWLNKWETKKFYKKE